MVLRSLPGSRDQRLAVLVLFWTLLVWVPRLFIIPVSDVGELVRVVGSFLVGLVVAYTVLRPSRFAVPALLVFAGWSVGVWGRSLWNYWTLLNPPELRLVHTLLASSFFYLAWRAVQTARGRRERATSPV